MRLNKSVCKIYTGRERERKRKRERERNKDIKY